MLLHESGLDVEEDMNVVVAARHDQVLSDVWQGKVDAGFVKESALDEVADRVRLSDLEVLAHTDPFPGWCVVKFPETDRVVADKMTRALLSLNWDNPNDRQALSAAGIRGFVDSSNVDLAPIRQAVDSLHLPY
jgi:ABC-type phosphate/phosphonate transport system substrate-binding protein